MALLREIKKCVFGHGWVECFESADDVVRTCANRLLRRDAGFDTDERKKRNKDFTGVASYEEACELLKTGYAPSVEKLEGGVKSGLSGQGKRISFHNDVVGFQPIVPLAIMNVPNAMQNCYMKPIKAKVLDVYYDMTVNCNISTEQLQNAGIMLMSAILELEMQGYRFNLYAIQTYSDDNSFDMLCTKIKNSNTPLDLRKISFPLTHPGYFRSIGFDWYTRMPKSKHRWGYGRALSYNHDEKKTAQGFREIFGKNVVVFSASRMLNDNKDHVKNVLIGTNNKVEKEG